MPHWPQCEHASHSHEGERKTETTTTTGRNAPTTHIGHDVNSVPSRHIPPLATVGVICPRDAQLCTTLGCTSIYTPPCPVPMPLGELRENHLEIAACCWSPSTRKKHSWALPSLEMTWSCCCLGYIHPLDHPVERSLHCSTMGFVSCSS